MTGMRSHTDHQSRLDWWRRQIQRQPKTKLTVANFCRQLGVSVPTFYYWKRRVEAGLWASVEPVAEASLVRPPTAPTAAFLPVSIVDPYASEITRVGARAGRPGWPRRLRGDDEGTKRFALEVRGLPERLPTALDLGAADGEPPHRDAGRRFL